MHALGRVLARTGSARDRKREDQRPVSRCSRSGGRTGALTPVTGSPFPADGGSVSVAFSPDGSLLATANEGDSTVSVFSVGAGTARSPRSPVRRSRRPERGRGRWRSVRVGGLLAIARHPTTTCRCSRSVRAQARSPRSPARRSRLGDGGSGLAALGCVQSGREPARDRRTRCPWACCCSRSRRGVLLLSHRLAVLDWIPAVRRLGCVQSGRGIARRRKRGRRGRHRVGVLARLADQGRAAVGADRLAG